MSITQQVLISAEPAQVYAILADASALSALSGMSGSPAPLQPRRAECLWHANGLLVITPRGAEVVALTRFESHDPAPVRPAPRPARRRSPRLNAAASADATATPQPQPQRQPRPTARSCSSSRVYAATVESSVIRPSTIISSNLARGSQAWRMSCSSDSRSGVPGSSPVARK